MVNLDKEQLRQWKVAYEKEVSELEAQVQPLAATIARLRDELEAVNRLLLRNGDESESASPNTADARHASFISSEGGNRKAFTPVKAYWAPILSALVDAGGSAHGNQVIERVGEKMKGILKPKDYESLSSGVDIRWRNRVAWQRFNMTRQGLLRSDSPRGVWEITPEGRKWLEGQRRVRDVG